MLTVRPLALSSLVLVLLAAACSSSTGDDVASDTSEVIGGDATTSYPDVAQITSGCTATLVHPRALLTAAHCCQRETSCKRVKIGGRAIETTANGVTATVERAGWPCTNPSTVTWRRSLKYHAAGTARRESRESGAQWTAGWRSIRK